MLDSFQVPVISEPSFFTQARTRALEAFEASNISLPKGFVLTSGSIHIDEKSTPCVALPFSKAFSTYGALIAKTFVNEVQEDKDPLLLLSHAMHSDGLFIYVPPGVCVDAFSLVHANHLCARVHIVIGKGSELHVEERFAQGCMTHVTCQVEEEGKLVFNSFAEKGVNLLTSYKIFLKEKAQGFLSIAQEACLSRSSFQGVLQGAGAKATYADFSAIGCGACSERFSTIEHKAAETSSQKYVKRVICEGGLSRYTGKIVIQKEGRGSKAHQMHRALTLGPNAVAFASPIFDIFQPMTQATHGSTIAPFDEAMLFYAKARGIEENEAKSFLIQAFFDDILKYFSSDVRRELEARIQWIR
jgi:Fe-S cluster assembly protein SufD